MRRGLLVSLLLGLWAVASACSSQPATPSEQARALEREVWSPYCPGRLLTDCTTTQARELRGQIEDRLEAGDSPDEVLAWIRRNHGDEALARPEASGPGLVVWLVPVGIFLVGAAAVGMSLRRWTRSPVRDL